MNNTPLSWVEPVVAIFVIGLLSGAAIACRTLVALVDYLMQPSPFDDEAMQRHLTAPAADADWRAMVRSVTLTLALMAALVALLLISWLRTAAGS